jgi:YVTN family beta-propeller protein
MRPSVPIFRLAATTAALVSTLTFAWAQQTPYLHAPSVNTYATHNPNGLTILPTGRYLQPVGSHIPVARWPHGLTLSPDGSTAFVASDGVGQFITDWQSDHPKIVSFTLAPDGARKRRSNAGGAAFSPDGRTLYWSSGESGEIHVVNVATQEVTATIPLNVELSGTKFADSFAMDVQISADGKFLYCADVTNFRLAVVDTAQDKLVGSVPVGRYPYALAVNGSHVYVANIGVFSYSPIPAPAKESGLKQASNAKTKKAAQEEIDKRGLTFPPFGFPSKEAREGVEVEGRRVPGLGDPNVPESFSVWGVDVSDPIHPQVVNKIKTGLLMGAPADQGKTIGGSAPNFVAVHGKSLYVSNGNNDTLQRIDLNTGKIAVTTPIRPSPLVAKLRGVGPSGMAVSPDGNRVYVAESGLNAIGVLDTHSGKMLGHIPSAWYPYRVAVSPDGKRLCAICFRGFGNGPKGSKNRPDSPYLGMMGAFIMLDAPTDAQLKPMTENTLAYNGIVDRSADRAAMASPVIPTVPGTVSDQIKYVVFITKENHTYDTIFDRIPGANDDPTLLRWGYHQKIAAAGQPTLDDAAVMTNHNALAKQFTVSDNFYMEPEASGVGHRWLIGVQPDNFCQMTYTLGWDFKVNTTAPGRRASFGSNGSIAPEDYPEAGSMWEHLARNGVSFRNYGESFEFAGVLEDDHESKTGAREVINMPMSKVVYDNTCRDFPIFNMNIPDQFRAKWFAEDVQKLFLKTGKKLPQFVNICICNDHGTGPNAQKGYPYVASWMADNDLALGKIVDFLSHTPYWKNMAIFVTQDDAGGENDHVDAQRSVLLVISPWARHHNVSHRQTTIVSMHRTLYEIFGLPALNMFDGLANDFSDCFTTTPDFTPYTHVDVDARIFDPTKTIDADDPDFKKARSARSIQMDDPDEIERVLHGG